MSKYEWQVRAGNSWEVEGPDRRMVARAEGTDQAVSFVEAHNAIVRELTEQRDGLLKACMAAHGCFAGNPEWWDLQTDHGGTTDEIKSEQLDFLAAAIAKARGEA